MQDDLLARLEPIGDLRARSMFGGVGFWCDEVFFAVLDDGVLYFRVDETTREAYRGAGSSPFHPIPSQPPMEGYWEVPAGVLDDDAQLCEWARSAVRAAKARAAKRSKPGQSGVRRSGVGKSARASKPLVKLKNLGPKSVGWLREAGITTQAELQLLGSVAAYKKCLASGAPVTLNLLYALEGALLDLRWDRLPEVVKQNLRQRLG